MSSTVFEKPEFFNHLTSDMTMVQHLGTSEPFYDAVRANALSDETTVNCGAVELPEYHKPEIVKDYFPDLKGDLLGFQAVLRREHLDDGTKPWSFSLNILFQDRSLRLNVNPSNALVTFHPEFSDSEQTYPAPNLTTGLLGWVAAGLTRRSGERVNKLPPDIEDSYDSIRGIIELVGCYEDSHSTKIKAYFPHAELDRALIAVFEEKETPRSSEVDVKLWIAWTLMDRTTLLTTSVSQIVAESGIAGVGTLPVHFVTSTRSQSEVPPEELPYAFLEDLEEDSTHGRTFIPEDGGEAPEQFALICKTAQLILKDYLAGTKKEDPTAVI